MQLVVDISRAFTQKQFTACVSKHTCEHTYRFGLIDWSKVILASILLVTVPLIVVHQTSTCTFLTNQN